jgi:uncharacterized membrane protein YhfC
MMLGAGHGGLESIGVSLVMLAGLAAYLAFTLLPADKLASAGKQVEEARKQFALLGGWEPFLGAWERLWTMIIHMGLSLLVCQAFIRGWQWWLYALIAHTVIDFTTVGLLQVTTSLWGSTPAFLITESCVAAYGLLALWLIAWFREQEIKEQEFTAEAPEPSPPNAEV